MNVVKRPLTPDSEEKIKMVSSNKTGQEVEDDDDQHSAGSILRSEEDSNAALDAMYRYGSTRAVGGQAALGEERELQDWGEFKQRRKERYLKAAGTSQELKLRRSTEKSR